jgi:hypothetical protein
VTMWLSRGPTWIVRRSIDRQPYRILRSLVGDTPSQGAPLGDIGKVYTDNAPVEIPKSCVDWETIYGMLADIGRLIAVAAVKFWNVSRTGFSLCARDLCLILPADRGKEQHIRRKVNFTKLKASTHAQSQWDAIRVASGSCCIQVWWTHHFPDR